MGKYGIVVISEADERGMLMTIGMSGMNMPSPNVQTVMQAKSAGYTQGDISSMVRSGQIECETCANRKYQDGSNEMVSFKSPAHVSPQASAAAVMGHEQEHVSNAYADASQNNGEVLQASVRISTATCPECGRTYVSGGETTTTIKYNSDPYAQSAKVQDQTSLLGQKLDMWG